MIDHQKYQLLRESSFKALCLARKRYLELAANPKTTAQQQLDASKRIFTAERRHDKLRQYELPIFN